MKTSTVLLLVLAIVVVMFVFARCGMKCNTGSENFQINRAGTNSMSIPPFNVANDPYGSFIMTRGNGPLDMSPNWSVQNPGCDSDREADEEECLGIYGTALYDLTAGRNQPTIPLDYCRCK